MVMDETTDMVGGAAHYGFLRHESCDICTLSPRRRLAAAGVASGRGSTRELARLEELTHGISGLTFCPMGTGMCEPVTSGLSRFRGEFEARVRA
jgi:NADH-quinone oxidoreductase subunit F